MNVNANNLAEFPQDKKYEAIYENENEYKEFQNFRSIFNINKNAKTLENQKEILTFLLKFNIFKSIADNLGSNIICTLFDYMELVEFEKDEVIMDIGDKVNRAYILLFGEIKIFSLNPIQLIKQEANPAKNKYQLHEKFNKTLNMFFYKTLKIANSEISQNGDGMNRLFNSKIKFNKYKKTNSIEDDWFVKQGELFGDRYIIDRKPSTMCYLTSTKCFLFEIKKRDYHTCLETYRKDEYLKELKFYHSISVFTELSRNALEKLRLSVKEIIYYNGEIVLKQGDPIKYIYIVKSGSFQVSYKWTKYIKNDFDINYYSNITPLDFRFTHDRGYEMKGYKKFEETLKLLTLEKGQFIGDLEFIHQKENSYFTAMSLHKGSALVSIPIKVFEMHIKYHKEDFIEFTKERENFYRERLKNICLTSKTMCFDNPENKYFNDLVVRIKNGMEYMKNQEKSTNTFNYKNEQMKDLEVSQKQDKNNFKECKKNKINEKLNLLEKYDRAGASNEKKFKKIKRNPRNQIKQAAINGFGTTFGEFYKTNLQNKSKEKLNRQKSSSMKFNVDKFAIDSKQEKYEESILDNQEKIRHHIKNKSIGHVKELFSNLQNRTRLKSAGNVRDIFFNKDNTIYSEFNIPKDNNFLMVKNKAHENNFGDNNINVNKSRVSNNNIYDLKLIQENPDFNEVIQKEETSKKSLLINNKKNDIFPYTIRIRKNKLFDKKQDVNNPIIPDFNISNLSLSIEHHQERLIKSRQCKTGKRNMNYTKENLDKISNPCMNYNKIEDIDNNENNKKKFDNKKILKNQSNIKESEDSQIFIYDESNIPLNTLNREYGHFNCQVYTNNLNDQNGFGGDNCNINQEHGNLISKIESYHPMNHPEHNFRKMEENYKNNVKNKHYRDKKNKSFHDLVKIRFKEKFLTNKNEEEIKNRGKDYRLISEQKCLKINQYKVKPHTGYTKTNLVSKLNSNNRENLGRDYKQSPDINIESKKKLFYSNRNHVASQSKNEFSDINVDISVFTKENFEKERSIFKYKSKHKLLESSEISKNIFIDSTKISNILNQKYDYMKNNCIDKCIEKSTILAKK